LKDLGDQISPLRKRERELQKQIAEAGNVQAMLA
jgi:hypothetical protein